MPHPSTQDPTPPHLAGHPATHAIQKVKSDNIPQEIIAAAKAAWGPGGANSMSQSTTVVQGSQAPDNKNHGGRNMVVSILSNHIKSKTCANIDVNNYRGPTLVPLVARAFIAETLMPKRME